MGKVFKALEKSGIDPSLIGEEERKEKIPEKIPTSEPAEKEDELRVTDDDIQEEEKYQEELKVSQDRVPSKEKSDKSQVDEMPPASEPSRKESRIIGKQAGPWDERLAKVATQGSAESESFRTLRSKLLYPADGRPVPRTILITSASPHEGKGFVAANLGISLARGLDQYSLLVDCDLRRPSLAKMFGLSNEFGLVNCLQEDKGIEQFLQKTSIDKLSILASGRAPANPAELLGSSRMEAIIHEMAARYSDRYIIFDSAPGEVAPESFVLAQHVDCVVLVVRYGTSNRSQIEKMVASIGKEKIVGIVFNGVKTNIIEDKVFGEYGSYGQYYAEEE